MNKTIKYLIIALVVLGVAYPGIAWLIGLQVQASMAKREQQVKDQFPGDVTLISRQYQRGVFGATEELTYGLGATVMQSLGPLAASAGMAPLRFTVRNTIHHGPFPQFRTVALATISTQIELPPQLTRKLSTLLGGGPPIQIESRLGWFGGATTVVTSPAYQGHLANGSQISWHGVKFTASANANLSSGSFDGTVGGIEGKSARFQSTMEGLHISADWKQAFEVLYTGPFALKIASVTWQSLPASNQNLVQGLSMDWTASVDGDNYKSAGDLKADKVQTSGFSITHAVYAISVEHLYAPTLAAMTKAMRESQNDSRLPTQPVPAAVLETLRKNGTELLLHDPVVNISRIGFTTPDGELRLSATASAPGLKPPDLEGPQLAVALMQHLNMAADLRIDAALATRLLASSGRKDALAAQIDAFERQGYIKRDGTGLTAHLTYAGGKLAINGQPYPPGTAR